MPPLAAADFVSVSSLIVTGLLAILTGVYVWLTHRIVQAQTAPCVIVHVTADESRPTVLQIVIENVGNGVARDVRFQLSEEIPHRAWGLDENGPPAEQMKDGPLIEGIPALGPRAARRMDWGQYPALRRELKGKKIDVTCTFKDGARNMKTRSVLEIESLKYDCLADSDGARQCARHLEKIEKTLRDQGFKRQA